jgi:hypothetical protein
MFVLAKTAVVDKAIAALVATAMVLWGVGAHFTAEAATLLNVSDLLSDSAPSADSDHSISFEIPAGSAGLGTGDTIVVDFDNNFNLTGVVVGDVDLEVNTVDEDLATDWNVTFNVPNSSITFTSVNGTINAGDVVEVLVGTVANGGTNQIANPAATSSYTIEITAGDDSAATEVAIVDNVTVTADVDTIFDFIISGLPAGFTVNGDTTTLPGTTTTIPFGTLDVNTPEVIGQELRVITNAINGFSVTVETNQQLTASNGAIIDSFANGTNINAGAATAWTSPTGNINSSSTWGHWGMTSDDANLTNGDEYGASLYSAVLTTPQEVFYNPGVTNGITANVGSTSVAYRAEIMSFQEAADDYTATLTYIATPTF